jgi:hypothetical protein
LVAKHLKEIITSKEARRPLITDVSIPYSERLFHNGAEQPATDDNGNKIKHSVKHEVFIVKKLVLGINNVKVS